MPKKPEFLEDSIQTLFSRHSVTAEKLEKSGILTLKDLIWVLPKKVTNIPNTNSFKFCTPDEVFRGQGRIQSIIKKPAWNKGKKGKFSALSNLIIYLKDVSSKESMGLKWFNVYPSFINQFREDQIIDFFGTVSVYNQINQIIDPEIQTLSSEIKQSGPSQKIDIHYGTVSGVGPKQIKKMIGKIPISIFNQFKSALPQEIIKKYKFPNIKDSFLCLHGLDYSNPKEREKALDMLIYEEFYQEQIQILKRRHSLKNKEGIAAIVSEAQFKNILSKFPYKLTEDQLLSLNHIRNDLESNSPMMRLIQGDVGCGKTCIAISASLITKQAGFQTAIMCPTESLAIQHFIEFSQLLSPYNIKVALLTSSTPRNERDKILLELSNGYIQIIIGTHSLINPSIIFKNLALVIIDEQHKFGVNQRIELLNKGEGTNCLILTATPIPRSLRLTQFGDLDVSTIKTMPAIRKGHKTKIIKPNNLQNFFNFLQTRLSMKEQAYIVVPAIYDDISRDIFNLENIFEKFKKSFLKRLLIASMEKWVLEIKMKYLSTLNPRKLIFS